MAAWRLLPSDQRFLFRLGHGAQRAREIGLAENIADARELAVGHEVRLRARPQIEKAAACGDALRAHFVDGESVGKFDRRRDHVVERFRAELAQREQTRVHHARHQRRHDPGHRNDPLQSAGIRFQNLADL